MTLKQLGYTRDSIAAIDKFTVDHYVNLNCLKELVSPTVDDCNDIFLMYNIYVAYLPSYKTNCGCRDDIRNVYAVLMVWFNKNKEQFNG